MRRILWPVFSRRLAFYRRLWQTFRVSRSLKTGLVAAIQEDMDKQKMDLSVEACADSIFAGAIGAALWGAFRHEKLAQISQLANAPHPALFVPNSIPGGATSSAPVHE